MNILFVLIPLSLLLACLALIGCVWAIKSGQYSDVKSPPQKLVFDETEDANK